MDSTIGSRTQKEKTKGIMQYIAHLKFNLIRSSKSSVSFFLCLLSKTTFEDGFFKRMISTSYYWILYFSYKFNELHTIYKQYNVITQIFLHKRYIFMQFKSNT